MEQFAHVVLFLTFLSHTSALSTHISALGRRARLGDLYDIRSGSFSQKNLFAQSKGLEYIPREFISTSPHPGEHLIFRVDDTRNSKYGGPHLSGDHLMEIKSGLIRTRFGASAHLYEDDGGGRQSAKEVEGYLHQTVLTSQSRLSNFLSQQINYEPYINLNTLESSNATHVVIGVLYGCECVLRFLDKNKEFESYAEVEARLQEIFKDIAQPSRKEDEDGNLLYYDVSEYIIKIYSDLGQFAVKNKPNNTLEVIQLIASFVKECKKKQVDFAVPISFELVQIRDVQSHYGYQSRKTVFIDINPKAYDKMLAVFDQIGQVQLHLSDMRSQIEKYACFVSKADVERFNNLDISFKEEVGNFRESARRAVVQVRSGIVEPRIFNRLTRAYEQSVFSAKNVHEMVIKGFSILIRKIESQPGHVCT